MSSNLATQIRDASLENPAEANLKASSRIIRRVTDGIYREPWAAFRELIANAYDADATNVTIHTDWPNFSEIRITDDGMGMSPDVVAYVIEHIGGSSKRTKEGADLGTTQEKAVNRSPKGRPLIGKIGIGLFAINHLTQHFQIITKVKGDNFRTVASVLMSTYADENSPSDEEEFETESPGKVITYTEKVSNEESCGTLIVLRDIRPEIQKILKSSKVWRDLKDMEETDSELLISNNSPPKYHIGNQDEEDANPKFPWGDDNATNPIEKMEALFEVVEQNEPSARENVDLRILDNYFRMIWKLALASPVEYVDKHPFEITGADGIQTYRLANRPRTGAEEITLRPQETIAKKLSLSAHKIANSHQDKFRILFDGIELRKPIRLPSELQGARRSRIKRPLLFCGKVESPWDTKDKKRVGGPLNFEAYFYWNNLILPKENRGILLQIKGASGTLFDSTFLNYPISEQTRLRQITAEVFVTEGLEAALNTDRESLNFSHPHYIYLRDWVHVALRQVTNKNKEIGRIDLENEREQISRQETSEQERVLRDIWQKTQTDEVSGFHFKYEASEESKIPNNLPRKSPPQLPSQINETRIKWPEEKHVRKEREVIEAFIVVLEAYDVLKHLSPELRGNLLTDLINVLARWK